MNKVMKALAAIMLVMAMLFVVGCTKPDDPNSGGNNNAGNDSGSINGHAYVNLGLPSGTLWATCNVGANSPEEFGDYFAWGETQPKMSYDWSTYKWCNSNYNQLTKYCNSIRYGYNGFTDNLTALRVGDDAAVQNMAGGWQMPSVDQWNELLRNTTQTWTTLNGVKGFLITATNGQSIFLPAAGCRYFNILNDVGFFGRYWSSSLYTDGASSGWYFYFNSMRYSGMDDFDRCDGISVRAVCSSR